MSLRYSRFLLLLEARELEDDVISSERVERVEGVEGGESETAGECVVWGV